jgi:Mrp family chromosome partitioning ATPase
MAKRTTPPRFGEPLDAPRPRPATGDTRARAPMPILTQPMDQMPREALRTMQFPQQDPTVAGDGHGHQAPAQGKETVSMTVRPGELPLPHHTVTGQPPEIGLTQHTLPDEKLDPRLVLVADPDSPRAANFRVLRHHLLEAGRPQVVVVSSPRPGDGKTTTAVNLALALAECGRAKVLLVECHLRRPQLASIFRFVPPWCFAEQLEAHRHQPMLPWGMVDIPQLWLHVAAVNPRIEQRQLLDAPAVAIAMERLRLGGYDHIVIDAPPVIGSADVNLIQDAADGVVLALKARRSTARDLRATVDQLTPARVIGSVLLE